MLENTCKKMKLFFQKHILLCVAGVLLTAICALATLNAEALYVLTTEDGTYALTDATAMNNIRVRQVVIGNYRANGTDIYLTRGQSVSIDYNGATIAATAKNETVANLLARLGIRVSPLEIVAIDESGETILITVASDIEYYESVTELASYETERIANPDMPKGSEKVVQEGIDGVQTAIYEVVYADGKLISRQLVEIADCTAQNEIIEYGTAVTTVNSSDRIASVTKNDDGSGYITMNSGATLSFSKTLGVTGTAYTGGIGSVGFTTASGTRVREGVVAVDKGGIPLGTRMYIVSNDGRYSYGGAVAEDTGVRGNHVDLYYDTYNECINFGRRSCTVYILE